ncbi:hypothetical protein ABZZ37_18260 [Streptomyces sp. NPDC006464]|uniref:hypothetical protein n=1 Tax=Streptomyces sp. NPDC006464 TaxID=3154305 RepID=UPI0033AA80B5
MASLTPHSIRPRPDVWAGAAAGLAGGAYLAAAPLLGGPVGMPGEAVRYLLLTGLLLAGAVGHVLRRRGRATGTAGAARRAAAVCVLAGAAPLLGSPMVFAGLLVAAAVLAGGSLALYRPGYAWHAACFAGAAAGGGATILLAQRPQVVCAVGCGLAALLLAPAGLRSAAPDDGRDAHAALSGWTVAAVGAAVFGTLFAGQSLVVFRWELLGGAGARPFAWAASAAAVLTCGLALAGGRPGAGAGARTALFAAGLTSAVAACAGAARVWQFTLALGLVLTCGAAAVVGPGRRGPRDTGHAVVGVLGGAAAVTAVVLSGRLLGGPDSLAAIGLVPAVAAACALIRGGRRTAATDPAGPAADPPGAATSVDGAGAVRGAGTAGGVGAGGSAGRSGSAGPAPLHVRGLGVRTAGAPPVRRLGLTVEAGEITYLTDTLPGRRAGAVLAVLGGLRRADAGSWWLRGHDVSRVAERGRWDLRMSAYVDPSDPARAGALPQGHPAASVTDAVAAATAHLGPERAAVLTAGARTAFPFLAAKGTEDCAVLGPDERCVLGLAQALIVQPALLLLDLTGPGCGPLAADPAVTAVLRRIADGGTAVLVAAPAGQAVTTPRPLLLPVSGGTRAARLRRNGKATS